MMFCNPLRRGGRYAPPLWRSSDWEDLFACALVFLHQTWRNWWQVTSWPLSKMSTIWICWAPMCFLSFIRTKNWENPSQKTLRFKEEMPKFLARQNYLPPLRRPNFDRSCEGYGRYDFPVSSRIWVSTVDLATQSLILLSGGGGR